MSETKLEMYTVHGNNIRMWHKWVFYVLTIVALCTYIHDWCFEEVTKGVVEQVEEGGGVQVCISYHLTRKKCLTGT